MASLHSLPQRLWEAAVVDVNGLRPSEGFWEICALPHSSKNTFSHLSVLTLFDGKDPPYWWQVHCEQSKHHITLISRGLSQFA